MAKTIKQIADELNVNKQRVYRYIKKNHITEAHQKNGVMYYDENAQKQITSYFRRVEIENITSEKSLASASFDVLLKQSEMLKNELEAKNEQIAQLQKLLDQQQQLNAMTAQKLEMLEQKEADEVPPQENKEKPWWQFWK